MNVEVILPVDEILKRPDGEERLEGLLRKIYEVDGKTFSYQFVVDPSGLRALVLQTKDVRKAHRLGCFVKARCLEWFGVKLRYVVKRRKTSGKSRGRQ